MAGTLPSDSIPNIGFTSFCGPKASLEVVPLATFFGLESQPWQLPHRRAYYQVLWVRTEAMEVRIDQMTLLLKPGQLLFVGPHQVLSVRSGGRAEGFVIRFLDVFLLETLQDAHFLNTFLLFAGDQFIASPDADAEAFLAGVLRTLQLECESYQHFGSQQIMRHALKIFLTKCQQFLQRAAPIHRKVSAHTQLAARFEALLNEYYRTKPTVQFYAEELGVQAEKLSETTKVVYGKTASRVIEERRLLEAKRLLYYGSLSVKEIAFHLHFTDASHFIRFFRKHQRMTPLAYREDFLANGLASGRPSQ
jgi:AraC-like DNA-binding protein